MTKEQERFDYAKISDKETEHGRADAVIEKGFYILPSELFENVQKNAKNNVCFHKIFKKNTCPCACYGGFLCT